ncbi:hypothetical protein [Acinetobacter sp. CFCC 10889]|uniref:hypothetical protein n=1 Tax=Acinetobacter sp. CFCC 10889 TaxID=1775557 RepID=UPI000DD0928A|nr:hypothetical protein [Acinetobacter sp. CFCC 10889]
MEQKIIGELFGVEVHSPVARGEVREVVRKQLEFKAELQTNQNLTEDQAFLEIVDIFDNFFANISDEDEANFSKMHAEEVSAAPREWFGALIDEHEVVDNKYLEAGIAGVLYDVEVKYPFTRDNIRTLVKARSDLMGFLANTHGISIYQASNDLSDEQDLFLKKFNPSDQVFFLNLMTEEMNAHTNALNDETVKINQQVFKQDVENQYYAQIIGGVIGIFCLIFILFVVFK